MNLYLVYANNAKTFCIGQEEVQAVYDVYQNQYGNKTNVAYITTLTDVTGDFDSDTSKQQ